MLLLDEPASGLDETETDDFADLLLELAGEGMAILLVEHDVQLVMKVADSSTCSTSAPSSPSARPTEIQQDQAVLDAYLGRRRSADERASTRGSRADADARAASACAPPTAASRCCTASTSSCPRARWSRCSARTAAGKTTTLKVASGQMTADRRAASTSPAATSTASAPDALARIGVCTIPEGRGVFPNLTVRENLRMVTYAGADQTQVEERAYARFPRLGERRTQLAGTMSGGEQQMLAMARGLAVDPALLLLDELSMGLAPLIVEELYEIVGQIAESGVSILVVEQFARTVLGVADYAAIMLHGRITSVGQPADIVPELEAAYLGAG